MLLWAGLALAAPALLRAQAVPPAGDSNLVLQLEHRFSDASERVVVTLERGVAYRISVAGPGTPECQDTVRGTASAFVSPVTPVAGDSLRMFEVYPYKTGAHALRLTGLPPGTTAMLRLYHDVSETRRTRPAEPFLTFGVQIGAGAHTGYRVDSTAGSPPKGGTDWDACALVEIRDRLGLSVGIGEQSFPSTSYSVGWTFVEARGRLASAQLLGGYRTDLGVAARYAEASGVGPGNYNPDLVALGLVVTQHFSATHHGWSLVAGWQHGRLGHVPEKQQRDSDRFMVGVSWVK